MTSKQYADSISKLPPEELRRMVGPDPLRPGPARYRVFDRGVDLPIWPIIGQLKTVTGRSNPALWDHATIIQTAKEWSMSLDALAAAILYYTEHGCAIDAWLAENEAALA